MPLLNGITLAVGLLYGSRCNPPTDLIIKDLFHHEIEIQCCHIALCRNKSHYDFQVFHFMQTNKLNMGPKCWIIMLFKHITNNTFCKHQQTIVSFWMYVYCI